MPKLIIQKSVSAPGELGADLLGAPRTGENDIVTEALSSSAEMDSGEKTFSFGLVEGPFEKYERKVEIKEKEVRETYDFKLAAPVWRILLTPLIKRFFRTSSVLNTPIYRSSPAPIYKRPWWAPAAKISARSAQVLALLCLLSVIAGYLGALLSQTITFVGDEFSANTRTQSYMLAIIRVGIILAFVLTAAADKYGRRRLVGIVAFWGCVFTILTAVSFDIVSYTVFQTIARALATSFAILVGIMAAEETPAGARAYAVSILSLSAGLGAGVVVWLLPIADLGETAWRILYLVPILALLGLIFLLKSLPETSRFESAGSKSSAKPHQKSHWRRLAFLGSAAFFLALFFTPASQFQNEFLRDERGFSGTRLTLFQLTTNTPGGIGIFLGGKLADLKGRKLVGVIGLVGGSVFIITRYLIGGWSMWLSGGLAAILVAAIIPALGVYSPELFSTTRRGQFGGLLAIMGVAGSVVGLLLIGWLAQVLDNFGSAFSLIAIAPLIVILLVLFKFPETANVELEELNPTDK